LKLKEVITEIYQRSGLWFINQIADSVACELKPDLSYGVGDRQKLDHYLLPDHEQYPTVFFLYGGNWRSGRRQDYRFVADTLLSLGCNVIIPDYRLYPLVRFDEIRQDVAQAFSFACNLTDQPLIVMGHSAGAQLGALLSLDDSLLSAEHRARITRFVGLAGPYDFYPFTEDDHWDLFAPEQAYPLSQAVNYVRADAPPMYLLHGEVDSRVRRGHSKSLMEKQQAVGGVAHREVYESLEHVEILLAFTRLHRAKSSVIRDIRSFLHNEAQTHFETETLTTTLTTTDLKGASNGT
tara:strand:+ start:18527 stop:19408 length:882 start_codon:yes stop_codon:yes gene_type:complete